MEPVDLLIIGAGPAGLSAAQYGARAGLAVLLAEEAEPGGQTLNIDLLENYPGLLPARPGRDLISAMRSQARDFGASLIPKKVVSFTVSGAGRPRRFAAQFDDASTVEAKAVILCAGAKPRALGVPGEKAFLGLGVSYCAACDGPFFKGKKIIVAGGGDAACDEARGLRRFSPHVVLVHRRAELRAQKALAERVLNDPAIEARFNTEIAEIRGDTQVRSALLKNTLNGECAEEETSAVFIFAGLLPQNGLARHALLTEKPELDQNGFVITDQRMATSVAGLFCAGDVRSSPFRQVVTAAGDGAVAAHSAAGYIARQAL